MLLLLLLLARVGNVDGVARAAELEENRSELLKVSRDLDESNKQLQSTAETKEGKTKELKKQVRLQVSLLS